MACVCVRVGMCAYILTNDAGVFLKETDRRHQTRKSRKIK